MTGQVSKSQFVWRDSVLVKSIEKGDWVVLENCNLCNPSILDRLNSLLEEGNWTLAINEQGLVDGKLRVLKAHPEFRIFFLINESTLDFSNISDPLRNRCVEVRVPKQANQQVDTKLLQFTQKILPGVKVPLSLHAIVQNKQLILRVLNFAKQKLLTQNIDFRSALTEVMGDIGFELDQGLFEHSDSRTNDSDFKQEKDLLFNPSKLSYSLVQYQVPKLFPEIEYSQFGMQVLNKLLAGVSVSESMVEVGGK